MGLVDGFREAGVQNIVASLTVISDQGTADFMRHFYGVIATGAPPAIAATENEQVKENRLSTFLPAAFAWTQARVGAISRNKPMF